MTNTGTSSRKIAAFVLAIAATVALHGGWMAAMDRDAIAATSTAA